MVECVVRTNEHPSFPYQRSNVEADLVFSEEVGTLSKDLIEPYVTDKTEYIINSESEDRLIKYSMGG